MCLGGYVELNVTFRGGQFFRYQGGTAGASASFMKNGFFVDGLFKVDALNLQLGVPLGTLQQPVDQRGDAGRRVERRLSLRLGPRLHRAHGDADLFRDAHRPPD